MYNLPEKENLKICDINVDYFCFEDEACEKKINFGEIYYPLEYSYCSYEKNLRIISLNKHKDFMLEALEKFYTDLFSQECFDYIYSYISDDLLKMFNIVPVPDKTDLYTIIYGISDKIGLNLSKKQNSTAKFDDDGIYYGTLIGNKIVSTARWNSYEKSKDKEVAVIGVDTQEGYRNRGYAVSNVVAMAEHMLDAGKLVEYRAKNFNTASQKTAKAAGLSEIKKEKLFYYQKNNYVVHITD